MSDKEKAERYTILRAPIGSVIHGLNVEGQDDRDLIESWMVERT